MNDILFPKVISFENPLEEASIIKREKRFFVEFTWEYLAQNKMPLESLWAHTNNTGSMMGLIRKGRRILLSKANNPKRKLGWTLEAICTQSELLGTDSFLQGKSPWLGVNTSLPNKFLQALFSMKDKNNTLLPWAEGYSHIRMEASNGESRLDACITHIGDEKETKPAIWVECKSVTLVEDSIAAFPDAVTTRGAKHLETLMRIVKEGQRAAMLYVVQRTDAACFSSADYIDPSYSQKLIEAYHAGVEIYVIVANVQKDGVYFGGTLPLAPCLFG